MFRFCEFNMAKQVCPARKTEKPSHIEMALIKIYFDAENRFRNKDALCSSESDLKVSQRN
ncbi:hypothetical protein T06_13419 [Trichinella sp. T6]|nr:hypothetical protein T06_7162 [Trichinella sp. T6]KRX58585.1 hypothetical protein T06_13419 [Trichinella sp. T6]